ncbi:class I SAM-dependent methyltransferase [Candidatus Woesearchaeota archaeon]|nr:class I SAM-dependent methyltransferase [Candidatus Woesearchaeota archaeon]
MQWEKYQESEFVNRHEGTVLAGSAKGRYFLSLLPKGKVLDLGCNDGGFTFFLNNNGFSATGFDLPGVVMKAKRNFPKVRFVGGSAEKKLPFRNNSFDAIIASEIIEHVRKDYMFVSECHRLLKDNGILILSTPNRNYLVHRILRFFGYKWNEGCSWHCREYSSSELKQLLWQKFTYVRISGIPFSYIDENSKVSLIERFLPKTLRHTLVAIAKK